MAHYAFLNDNNIVTEVIVGKKTKTITQTFQKALIAGKHGMQIFVVKPARELLTTLLAILTH